MSNPAATPTAVEDVQGDSRWISMVGAGIGSGIKSRFLGIMCKLGKDRYGYQFARIALLLSAALGLLITISVI